MIERILVPLDGSTTAEAVLPQVRRLARPSGSELILVRAVPVGGLEMGESTFRAGVNAATEYVAGIQSLLQSWGFPVRAVVRVGGAAETVLGVAAETRASLLAVATHGRTGASRVVLGSIAETLLRSTPVPVLAVRPFWTYEILPEGGVEFQPIRTILVAVGEGGLSLCVVPHAMELARLFGSRVMVLHAETSGPDEAARTAVAEIAERFRLEGIDTTTLIEPGKPVDTIVSACTSRGVDLAVLSTHGRSGFSRLVLGSVTEDVLRRVRVPLLVVRGDPLSKVAWRASEAAGGSRS